MKSCITVMKNLRGSQDHYERRAQYPIILQESSRNIETWLPEDEFTRDLTQIGRTRRGPDDFNTIQKEPKDCVVCGMEFDTLQDRRNHELNQHGIEHQDDFQCYDCPKRFRTNRALTSHEQKQHNPLGLWCQLCSREYQNIRDVLAHEQNFHNLYRDNADPDQIELLQ